MKPEWEKTAAAARAFPLIARRHNPADINGPKEKELSRRFGIRGYPTVFFLRRDGPGDAPLRRRDYDGDMTAAELLIFAKKMSGPAVIELPSVDALPPEQAQPYIVLLGTDSSGAYGRIAQSLHHRRTMFYAVPSATLPLPAHLTAPGTLRALPAVAAVSSEGVHFFPGPWNQEALAQWIAVHRHPLVIPLTRADMEDLRALNRLMVLGVVNSLHPNTTEKFVERFASLARRDASDERLLFVLVDAARYTQFVRHYGVQNPNAVPRIVVLDTSTQESWTDAGLDVWDMDAVRAFVVGTLGGAKPTRQPLLRKMLSGGSTLLASLGSARLICGIATAVVAFTTVALTLCFVRRRRAAAPVPDAVPSREPAPEKDE